MLNRSAGLAMSTCVLKALPGKLDIKRHSTSILYSSRACLEVFSRGACGSGVISAPSKKINRPGKRHDNSINRQRVRFGMD